ncbi:hypothetical protein OS128_05285 [Corynebacterium sp. P5848]|uniref:hypothetical protein n=1 Tax=Corynebacterium marambiense TaxID=2765364 RepID=UPI002260E7E0|nr:hypothetical protein [Corynebacterium marambiense]MCX7542324.1 hypothetical protein [Corynebacterium marambiense]
MRHHPIGFRGRERYVEIRRGSIAADLSRFFATRGERTPSPSSMRFLVDEIAEEMDCANLNRAKIPTSSLLHLACMAVSHAAVTTR